MPHNACMDKSTTPATTHPTKENTMKTSSQDLRIAAINRADHRASVLAAAAADRHAKSFTAMFTIDAPVDNLELDDDDLHTYPEDVAAMT